MKYLYSINYDRHFKQLCHYEAKILFNQKLEDNRFLYSDVDIDVNQSIFIKEKMEILYTADSFYDLLDIVYKDKYQINDFKIVIMDITKHKIEYNYKLPYMISMSYSIDGVGDIKNPKTILGITKVNNKWHLGIYFKNIQNYKLQNDKPNSYSNSLPYDLCRTILNIACQNDYTKTIIDPCCGAGTLVIDGLCLNLNIKGCEINPAIGYKAIENIKYLGYENVVEIKNMLDIDKEFDISIVDIPYGLLSDITKEQQQAIINKCARISKRFILITGVDMSDMLNIAGFRILKELEVSKNTISSFSRMIYVCEVK